MQRDQCPRRKLVQTGKNQHPSKEKETNTWLCCQKAISVIAWQTQKHRR